MMAGTEKAATSSADVFGARQASERPDNFRRQAPSLLERRSARMRRLHLAPGRWIAKGWSEDANGAVPSAAVDYSPHEVRP